MKAAVREADEANWRAAAESALEFVSLWGDEGRVRMALRRREPSTLEVLSFAVVDKEFPSVAALRPPAARLERTLVDLHGWRAAGATDRRPWLDHGRWPIVAPLGESNARSEEAAPYAFLTAEGDGLHQIPVGPVHAGIIEPGHFRFFASGETVVRLEERLGYLHKGVDALMRGADLSAAARLAGRISGDSTVAYAFAFALAAERALDLAPPPRAVRLRGIAAELERVANHLGDIGAICNDAAFAIMLAHGSAWRERALRAASVAFGHRLMMDVIVPGGLSADIGRDGPAAIRDFMKGLRAALPRMRSLYDKTASLQDRTVRTGVLSHDLAARFSAGGPVGRASGRDFDSRRDHAYAPYDQAKFAVVTRDAGDVNARVWVRFDEIDQSLDLIEGWLARLPEGPVCQPVSASAGEGFAFAEAFRGEVFAAVRLDAEGRVARAHFRDASWLQWPLLEAAIEGNIVADFPLCNKSFNCSYSGADL